MKNFLYFFLLLTSNSFASELPREVENFIYDRDLCDHFRGEGYEGESERAAFVRDSLYIYCAGTTDRLSALKRRYRDDTKIIELLGKYENDIGN